MGHNSGPLPFDLRIEVLLALLLKIACSSLLWVLIGVPVAAMICAYQLSFFVIILIPAMASAAAVFGCIQALWRLLLGRSRTQSRPNTLLLGFISGGILGFLAFPPLFSQAPGAAEGNSKDEVGILVFAAAAVMSGALAGVVASMAVSMPASNPDLTLSWKVGLSCSVLFALCASEYVLYGQATLDRIPPREVSRSSIEKLAAGNAQGSKWTGCYWFWGKLPLNKGGQRGLLQIRQTEGRLEVSSGLAAAAAGGVDRSGRFRFGVETSEGHTIVRELWEGTFHGVSMTFVRCSTFLNGSESMTQKLSGAARRIACPVSGQPATELLREEITAEKRGVKE